MLAKRLRRAKTIRAWPAALAVLVILAAAGRAQEPAAGLRVPPGFVVTEFAGSDLANDIYTLTVDPQGRIVVAGRGYIRILVDDDGDGRADRAIDVAGAPKDGAMGLLWEGDTLYVTGDGGLRRVRVKDGKAAGPSELLRAMKTGGEHAAHAIRRGPDGWLYVLCGNNTGIDKSYATLPTSPIKEPVAGCVLRFAPTGHRSRNEGGGTGIEAKDSEVVAHGFRNPYGMDFFGDELFTFDSDNERCVSLPWYEPTRFYHVIDGGHYGWLSPQRAQFWRLPPYFVDVVAPAAYVGRGSPTGVARYWHNQFPEEYNMGFFLCDWTFGKIHFLKLERKGATYTSKPKVFLEATGDDGFAPTGIVMHPSTGDLYVAIGGRGTRGAVYRVRYPKGIRPDLIFEGERGKRGTPKNMLEWSPFVQRMALSGAESTQPNTRLHALSWLTRHVHRIPSEDIVKAMRDNLDHSDRYVRQATARLLETLTVTDLKAVSAKITTPREHLTFALGTYRTHPDMALVDLTLAQADEAKQTLDDRLTMIRVVQLLLGDIVGEKGTTWEGYTPRKPVAEKYRPIARWLKAAFPTGDADVDRELARTLALLAPGNDPILSSQVLSQVRPDGDPVENLHYLMAHARLPGTRWVEGRSRVADVLLGLDAQARARRLNRDTHWPLRVGELVSELAGKDPKLPAALLSHVEFGRPDHVLFAQAPGMDRKRAAEVFLKRASADPSYAWNAGIIELLGQLPDERIRPTLRQLWGQAGLDAAILPLLARNPQPDDREKFVAGLTSPNVTTIRQCLTALDKLPAGSGTSHAAEALALIRGFGQALDNQKPLRDALLARLGKVTGQKHGADKQAWTAWFTKAYPALAAKLTNPDGIDVAAWDKRLAKLDWSAGDADRGRAVFVKASCATCHSGSQALGPDLAGVTGRFSRADLFTTLLQPSRDVPARYQTTLVETADGKVYQGIVVYDAVDSLILQTAATTTVRLGGGQVAARRPSAVSLMPAGLLDPLSDGQIVDLYAYLRTLGKR